MSSIRKSSGFMINVSDRNLGRLLIFKDNSGISDSRIANDMDTSLHCRL